MNKFEESNFYKALQDFFINADKKTFLQFLAEFYNRTEGIINKNETQDDLIKELRELYLEFNEKGIDENIVREKVNYFLENNVKIKDIISKLTTNTNNIKNISSQLDNNTNNMEYIKISNFGLDFTSFKNAILYCKENNKNLNIDTNLVLTGVTPITIDFVLKIKGNLNNIKIDNTLFECVGSLFLDSIKVDLNNESFHRIANVRSGSYLNCTNSIFMNFKNDITPKECIIFNIENGSKTYFDNITLNNIKSIGDGNTTDSIGSQRFIRTIKNGSSTDSMGTTVIKNIFIKNFYNIDENNNPITEDSDPIVFQHGLMKYHNCIVDNVKCENVGKRVIKIQSPNLVINNVYLNNSNFTGENTVISIQTNGNNITIDNVEIDGNSVNTKAFELYDCNNININNIRLTNVNDSVDKWGSAFRVNGKNITIKNVTGDVGCFLAFTNESLYNIKFENIDLKVKYYSIYYDEFKDGLDSNITFNKVNLSYNENSFNKQCILIRNGNKTIKNIYFNDCNFNLLSSYQYGILLLANCDNVSFNKCYINTNNIGQCFILDTSNNIYINNSIIDNIYGTKSTFYLSNSKIDSIYSLSNENKIIVSSLLIEPNLTHSGGSTPSVLYSPYNIN